MSRDDPKSVCLNVPVCTFGEREIPARWWQPRARVVLHANRVARKLALFFAVTTLAFWQVALASPTVIDAAPAGPATPTATTLIWVVHGSVTIDGTSGVFAGDVTLPLSGGSGSFGSGPAAITINVSGSSFTISGGGSGSSVGGGSCQGGGGGSSPITQTSVAYSAAGGLTGVLHCVFPDGSTQDYPITGTFSAGAQIVIVIGVDDPCAVQGGSSVGCQNQSLGEDVPIVGTGFFLHYQSDRVPGRSAANAVATADALALGGWTLSVHHAYDPQTNTLFLGDGGQRSTWQLAGSTIYNGSYLVTSQDGNEIYIFDPTSGHHLQTLMPLTGAVKYQFGYDAAGNLSSVTDGSGNVTTIQRNSLEFVTAIVSPFSQTTTLTLGKL